MAAHQPPASDLTVDLPADGQGNLGHAPAAETGTRFLGIFRLRDGVTSINFIVYLVAAALGICIFVFLNSSQGFVLGNIVHVPSSSLGDASGSLTFYDELVSVFAVWLWGIASDHFGRRAVYSSGFFVMAVGLAAFTLPTRLYPDLLLVRLVFAVGGAASSAMMTAVLADYAAEESRGKLAGLVGLVSGCGALLALFVLLRLPPKFGDGTHGLRVTFLITAGLSLAAAVLMWIGLQRPDRRSRQAPAHSSLDASPSMPASLSPASSSSAGSVVGRASSTDAMIETCANDDGEVKKSLVGLAKEGAQAGRDLRVLLGYAGSFLARGDTIILTLFLPLWVYRHYLDSGLCQAPGGVDDPDIKTHCREAYLKASVLSGVGQTFALVGAPLFGLAMDRFYRPFPILFAGLLGGVSYTLVFAQSTPSASIMFLYICLIGLAEIGLVVGSLSLVTASYVPVHVRGSVAGVSSLAGALGILINTKLGGTLFDSWVPTAPFFIMALGHAVFCVLAAVVVAVDFVKAKAIVAKQRGSVGGGGVVAVMRKEFEASPLHL
ncbi:hypothetical protein HDU87_000760 [Geranomyces variabilis]|uniref:Major facilitator superfamily (MFS) profile domain-containing protein n=1 Tax=Geranomyces variabilis TaxID=109894 RepID=A0AAD5TQG3_9FUNG|nr:hypothetical protein HDU87_000760 [Geranomyces variabilis]